MYVPSLHPVPFPTRIAVIGCGYWGMNYVRVLRELRDAEVSVCDSRTGRLDEVARRFPGVALHTDVEDVLHDPGIDAVVVCTPASAHHDVAIPALRAGKHMLVEKPLTVTVEQASDVIDHAAAADRILLIGHTFIYNEGVRHVKRLVDEGSLGETYYLYATRTNLGPFRTDINALWDLAPHDIAIFNHLLEDVPDWVSAVGGRVLGNGLEDVGFLTLRYPAGNLGHIHVSWADPHKVRECVVVGSDRRIAFNDLHPFERVRVFDRGVRRDPGQEATTFGEILQIREGEIHSPALPATEPLKQLCGHFLHCIRRGEEPRTSGPDGRNVVAVMQAVQGSLRRDGAPVAVERSDKRSERGHLASAIR